jgi:hypothetical protein
MQPIETTARVVCAVLALAGFIFAATNWCSDVIRLRIVSLSLGLLTLAFFLLVRFS